MISDRRPRSRLFCAAGLLIWAACSPPTSAPEATWQLALENLPGGLLSISGASESDVYAVGVDPEDGRGPLVVHYDGQTWRRLTTGLAGDLWWIADAPIGGAFFMTGEGGLIVRHEPDTGQFERFDTPGAETIFGVWGRSADNVYAVGGNLDAFETGGVIWHYDGSAWSPVDVTPIDPDGIPVLFKIWGRSPTELYAVGARGVVLRFDGESWARIDSPTQRTLFGVYGDEDLVVACGGALSGVIVEQGGASFDEVTPAGTLQMNGAVVSLTGAAYVVGREGAVAARTTGGWSGLDTGLELDPILHFHGPWADPQGGVWAVGGNLDGEPVDQGMIVYYGRATIRSELSQ